ncbi:MAG TPA: zinc-binding dehydrogenase, partial [Chloroflexota bacterium]|nr:zinc-binding dehydrogenase [Chloroflexota bacterium]
REAGADHVVNYKAQDVVAEIRRISPAGVDRIVDVDFGGNLPVSLQILKPSAVIASYATRGETEPKVAFRALMQKNITIHAVLVYTMPEVAKLAGMADVTRALADGALRPVIGAVMDLSDIAKAHAAVERGTIIGNVVLHV